MSPAQRQAGGLHVAAHGGFTLGLNESPPYPVARGLSVSTRTAERWRIGIDCIDAKMFDPYESHESHAWTLTPAYEYGVGSAGQFGPCLSSGSD